MTNKKNKTVWGVIGVILTLFGVTMSLPILLNKEYISWILVTALSTIIGVILIAWAISD